MRDGFEEFVNIGNGAVSARNDGDLSCMCALSNYLQRFAAAPDAAIARQACYPVWHHICRRAG